MSSRSGSHADATISVTQDDGWYVAKDETSGVVSQGRTKANALEQLSDAIELAERSVPDSDQNCDQDPSAAPWL